MNKYMFFNNYFKRKASKYMPYLKYNPLIYNALFKAVPIYIASLLGLALIYLIQTLLYLLWDKFSRDTDTIAVPFCSISKVEQNISWNISVTSIGKQLN